MQIELNQQTYNMLMKVSKDEDFHRDVGDDLNYTILQLIRFKGLFLNTHKEIKKLMKDKEILEFIKKEILKNKK